MTGLKPLRRWLLLQYLATVGLLLAAAGGAVYVLMQQAGERELDTLLQSEIKRLAAAVELDPKKPHIDGKRSLERSDAAPLASHWQILLEDGTTLLRSRRTDSKLGDLPAVGGDRLAIEELCLADASFGEDSAVRAARLRTLRQRSAKANPKPKKGQPPGPTPPQEIVFDLRAVVSRAGHDEQMARLRSYLLAGYPAALTIALVGGLLLIRKAVRPVELAFDRERRFSSAVSHELRTPLTAIRGEIDLALRRERTSGEYADTLRRVQPVVLRMSEMIEGLLILARSKGGHLLYGAGEFSAATLQQAIGEVIALLPGRERVSLTSEAPEETAVRGDPLLVSLAIRNLVENALFYAPQSSVQVRITAENGHGMRLQVEDQGPGISPEVMEQLKAAPGELGLSRGDERSTRLGLSIARAVAEAHGGTLTLAPRPGGGCVAEILLPIADQRLGTLRSEAHAHG